MSIRGKSIVGGELLDYMAHGTSAVFHRILILRVLLSVGLLFSRCRDFITAKGAETCPNEFRLLEPCMRSFSGAATARSASATAADAAVTSNAEGRGHHIQGSETASATDSSARSAGSPQHDAMALYQRSRYDAAYHQVGIRQQPRGSSPVVIWER